MAFVSVFPGSRWSRVGGAAALSCRAACLPFALFGWLLVALAATGCRPASADCSNGGCVCDPGGDCDFSCEAPPCHATCAGDNDHCSAVCSNGDCVCGSHSSCDFACGAPPCHVTCGPSASCHGECANGQCTCQANSACDFTCVSSPCHTSCASGAHCTVRCPSSLAGTSGCDIVACAAGAPVICPNGNVTTCDAPCPK